MAHSASLGDPPLIWQNEGLIPVEQINESTRQVFAQVGEEYDEICDRLFAGDPVFSYQTNEDVEPQ